MYKYIFTYSGVLITNEKQLGVKKQSTLHLTKKKKKEKEKKRTAFRQVSLK